MSVAETADGPRCECCDIASRLAGRGDLYAFRRWTLNLNQRSGARANFVLQAARHVSTLAGLDGEELAEMGRLLSCLDGAIRSAAHAERVYVLLLNEAGHVHWQLVPRWRGDPEGEVLTLLRATSQPYATIDRESIQAAAVRSCGFHRLSGDVERRVKGEGS